MENYTAGVDEVGRGPLAGPVVTAAVILKRPLDGLTDSKKLTPKKENISRTNKRRSYLLCLREG